MPCENYKDALIEAAASGAEPQAELRAHLDSCAACRTAFVQEQSLFVSIDSGLRQSVSAEVPASLLPRVRACIAEETVPSRRWFTNWLTVATAAAIITAFFITRVVWHSNRNQNPLPNTAQTNSPIPVLPSPKAPAKAPEPPARVNSHSNEQTFVARSSPNSGREPARNAFPEVLVLRDQEVLLSAYAKQWGHRKRTSLLAQNSSETDFAPLEVAPIQIAELDVKLLADEKSQ
jgi:hypothetical protein